MTREFSDQEMAAYLHAQVETKQKWIDDVSKPGKNKRPDWTITLALRDVMVLRQAERDYRARMERRAAG